MPENNFLALAHTLQQSTVLDHSLAEMLAGLKKSVEQEYLQKIHAAADAEKAFTVEHPPKEVTLLRALAPFTDEKGRTQLERLSQSLLFLHSLQHVNQRVQTFSSGSLLEARSADGQSPVSSAQSAQMAGLLLTLALAERF